MALTASYSILVVGTLDTKGNEVRFLRDRLIEAGLAVTVVDIGVLGPPLFHADVSREEIAWAAGESITRLVAAEDRGRATATMHRGLAAWVRERRERGLREGMMAIGGSAGTAIATAGMRELPIGAPKLMVSTMASGDVRPYVGTSDICMMYSVADFTGLNSLTSTILANAAEAMAGMCGRRAPLPEVSSRTLLAATMFGNTTPCVNRVKELLEDRGYELLVFHATGTGGQAMERLVVEGFVKGVLDITTTELADELVGGVLTAGPHRLEAAGKRGVPQVVSVGALDMVNFGAPETVPSKFAGRLFYQHNPAVTLMRTTPEENRELGEMLARKLNQAQGPVVLMLPLQGISGIDCLGKPFYDPVADKSLFDALHANVGPNVKLVELDLHINDPEFAEAIADQFLKCTEASSGFSVGTAATPGVGA
ncbi:MAG: Tm-1-like ATP-binding domain-containing protein [Acidobacteria bacterium]|nr:Tm-1-like ATP-binding domain-containing protein [Acidobacteriota bacterium]